MQVAKGRSAMMPSDSGRRRSRARSWNSHLRGLSGRLAGRGQAHQVLSCWGNSGAKRYRWKAVRPDRARNGGCGRRGCTRAAGRAASAVGALRARPGLVPRRQACAGKDPRHPAICRQAPGAPACLLRRHAPCVRFLPVRSDQAAPWSGDGLSTLATTSRIDQRAQIVQLRGSRAACPGLLAPPNGTGR